METHSRVAILQNVKQMLSLMHGDATIESPEPIPLKLSLHQKQLNDAFRSLQDIDLRDDICNKETEPYAMGASSDVFRAWSIKYENTVAVKRIRVRLLGSLPNANNNVRCNSFVFSHCHLMVYVKNVAGFG